MHPILAGLLLLIGFTAALYLLDWLDGLLHRWRTRRGKEKLRWR